MAVELTLTNRGRVKLCFQGFLYTRHKRLANELKYNPDNSNPQ